MEKRLLVEGQRKQEDQKGGCCNIEVKTLKNVIGENYPGSLSTKPHKQLFFLAFNLPKYHKSERLLDCYKLF